MYSLGTNPSSAHCNKSDFTISLGDRLLYHRRDNWIYSVIKIVRFFKYFSEVCISAVCFKSTIFEWIIFVILYKFVCIMKEYIKISSSSKKFE